MTTLETPPSGPTYAPSRRGGERFSLELVRCALRQITASGLAPGATFLLPNYGRTITCLKCAHCQRLFPRLLSEHRAALRKLALTDVGQTFCSQECARHGKPVGAATTCRCGAWKAPHAKICQSCHIAALNDRSVLLACRQCGKEFRRQLGERNKAVRRHGDGGGAYCGKACYNAYRREHPVPPTPPTKFCLTCSKPMAVRQRQKFCSHGCYTQHKRAAVSFDGYVAYRGDWLTKKGETVNRDTMCRLCAAKEAVEVHHIDHDPTNNTLANLITLCRRCHMQYHHKSESERQAFSVVFAAMVNSS